MTKNKIAKPKLTKLERKWKREVDSLMDKLQSQHRDLTDRRQKVVDQKGKIQSLTKRIDSGRQEVHRLQDCVQAILDIKHPSRRYPNNEQCGSCGHEPSKDNVNDEIRFLMLVTGKIESIVRALAEKEEFPGATRFTR